jgi:hypothetical protein
MSFASRLSMLALLSSSLLSFVSSSGEEAVIVYSRDQTCQGKEMIRAFTNECKQYYANDDAAMDYFRFHCDKNSNTLTMVHYLDKDCLTAANDDEVTVLMDLNDNADPGSCQTLGEVESNYHSAQLFCGGISAINNPKTFFSAFESEKVMFRHFTNSDDTCSDQPSVIELVRTLSLSLPHLPLHRLSLLQFTQRTCLYFPALDSSVHTGVYSMFAKEVSEGTRNQL